MTEANLARQERRAGLAVLRGAVARVAERHFDRATGPGQHLGVRPGAQDRARKKELAWAIEERDAQRAATEQKAQEVELLNATLQQMDEALEARAAQCARLEEARDAQAVFLAEKEALIERQESDILTTDITLTAAKAEIEEGRKCIAVSTMVKFSVLDFAEAYLLFVSRAAEEGVGGDRGEGGPPGRVRVPAEGP